MSPINTSGAVPTGPASQPGTASTSQGAFAAGEQTPSAQTEGSTVTALAGSNFLLCTPEGEILPGGSHGFYAGDTRLVSELRMRVDGHAARLIDSRVEGRLVQSLATVGDPVRPQVLVDRRTRIEDGLIVELEFENLTSDPYAATIELTVASDFADVFDVKRGVAPRAGFIGSGPIDGVLVLSYESSGFRRGLRATCDQPYVALRDGLHVPIELTGRARATIRFDLTPIADPAASATGPKQVPLAPGRWELGLPRFRSSWPTLDHIWDRSCGDLASLLLADDEQSDRPIVAAGSPWFMALFGRDSLITSWSALPLDHGLALGTLEALAARQGTRHVPESAEEPGRILHELRSGEVVLRPDGWGAVYYGSVDATPLFVMTLAELWRWGATPEQIEALLPAAERAVRWLQHDGDPDGDGFVEYGRVGTHGVASLANQGWKDSDDAIRHPDGSLATGSIALVEVQGYAVAAYRALADLREAFGTGDPTPLRERADALLAAIDAAFWMPDEGCHALALDGAKRPVRSVSTNAGHLLWCEAVLPERVAPLTERLMAPDMFTGYGLRTLSSSNVGFNPLSYHCGSVWPHDSALVAAGMFRSGATDAGARLATGLIEAGVAFGGRPPELFGGFPRRRFGTPVSYPTSCSPQAWASASTILLVRSMLGLRPDVPNGTIHLDPQLPPGLRIEMTGVQLGRGRLDLLAHGTTLEAVRVSEHLAVSRRSPTT